MPFPFGLMPTLREFVDAAVSQTCRKGNVPGLVGPKGNAYGHDLVGKNGVVYPLPDMHEDERLAPSQMASMVRALKLKGFDDLLGDLV